MINMMSQMKFEFSSVSHRPRWETIIIFNIPNEYPAKTGQAMGMRMPIQSSLRGRESNH